MLLKLCTSYAKCLSCEVTELLKSRFHLQALNNHTNALEDNFWKCCPNIFVIKPCDHALE
jgi:hypothetical protein